MPLPVTVAVASVVLAVVAGGLVGVLTRHWLAWLRRGAHVPAPWCVVGLGTLWGGAVAAWAVDALPDAALPLTLGLGWLVVAGSTVDLAAHRLPDALTIPAAPVVLVLLVPLGVDAVARGALAGLVLCAAHAVVRLAVPAAMGGGDVKLAAAVGAALGGMSWSAVVVGTVLACLLTALAGALPLGVAAHPDREPAGPGLADATRPTVARPSPAASGPAPADAARSCSATNGAATNGAATNGAATNGAATNETAANEADANGAARIGTVPHGPSMVIACLVVVGIASTGPAVPVPSVGPASAAVPGRVGDGGPGGCPTADMAAQASPWSVTRPRVRG